MRHQRKMPLRLYRAFRALSPVDLQPAPGTLSARLRFCQAKGVLYTITVLILYFGVSIS